MEQWDLSYGGKNICFSVDMEQAKLYPRTKKKWKLKAIVTFVFAAFCFQLHQWPFSGLIIQLKRQSFCPVLLKAPECKETIWEFYNRVVLESAGGPASALIMHWVQ